MRACAPAAATLESALDLARKSGAKTRRACKRGSGASAVCRFSESKRADFRQPLSLIGTYESCEREQQTSSHRGKRCLMAADPADAAVLGLEAEFLPFYAA